MNVDAGVDAGVMLPTRLTATGSLSGMISAPKPQAGHDAITNTSSFNLKSMNMGLGQLVFKVDINIGYDGLPMSATYSSTSAGFTCNAVITSGTAADDTWVALFNSPAGANKGTCSLTLTRAMSTTSGYDVSGTVTITGAAEGGAAGGMVTVTGTF
ncbi:MAG: hypothetical protein JNK82_30695 [Myxococcaceae bacterium]|nr:hypothetical protein [Myxococcaceae bacterium]